MTTQPDAPVEQNLTARIARDRDDLPQVLLVDDQPNQVLPWLTDILHEYAIISVSSVSQLRELLAGEHSDLLPSRELRPVAALVDLDLGAAGGRGVTAIRDLRGSEQCAATTIALFTNGLATNDDRDLHAVLCAYANAGPLLASAKDEAVASDLRSVIDAAFATSRTGGTVTPRTSVGKLRLVRPILYRGAHSKRPHDLVEILLGDPVVRSVWRHYRDVGMDFGKAVAIARDECYGLKHTSEKRLNSANELLGRSDFGDLIVAWHKYGMSFLEVSDGTMETTNGDQGEDRSQRTRRQEMFAAFYARYGVLLAAPDTHDFAVKYLKPQ